MKTAQSSGKILKPILFLILGLFLIGVAWRMSTRSAGQQKINHQRQEFFTATAIQLLNEEQQRNQEAVDRARSQPFCGFVPKVIFHFN